MFKFSIDFLLLFSPFLLIVKGEPVARRAAQGGLGRP
jgi:hypothetical protein